MSRVFFGADFISVTKTDGDWRHLKPAILGAIMEHFTRELPLMTGAAAEDGDKPDAYSEADAEIVAQIKELIETRVRPAVAQRRRRHHLQGIRRRRAPYSCICTAPARAVRLRP